MRKSLKGKIHWVGDKHYSSMLENGAVEDHLISFSVLPDHSYPEGKFGFEVNLLRKDIGVLYEGDFKTPGHPAQTGRVNCEVFRSAGGGTKIILHGNWYHEVDYEWWAILK